MSKQLMALALAAAAVIAAPAHATTVALEADGTWNEFDVAGDLALDGGNGWIDTADGSPLNFTFTIAAGQVGTLTVVDTVYAGDTFSVTNFGSALGTTSSVPLAVYDPALTPVYDDDAALADATFSHGVFQLKSGSYSISGALLQSVYDSEFGSDLDATSGGLRLSVSAIPEPSKIALLIGGLGAVALLARRRKSATRI